MEQRQRERQSAMRDAAAQGTVLDKVKQVIACGSISGLLQGICQAVSCASCEVCSKYLNEPQSSVRQCGMAMRREPSSLMPPVAQW